MFFSTRKRSVVLAAPLLLFSIACTSEVGTTPTTVVPTATPTSVAPADTPTPTTVSPHSYLHTSPSPSHYLHTYTHADASGSATSGACSFKSHGYNCRACGYSNSNGHTNSNPNRYSHCHTSSANSNPYNFASSYEHADANRHASGGDREPGWRTCARLHPDRDIHGPARSVGPTDRTGTPRSHLLLHHLVTVLPHRVTVAKGHLP